ncbi:MAG: prenyltransferase [Anaerolineae bacterium]
MQAWIKSFRLQFLPQGVMPVLLGTAIAWRYEGYLNLTYFLLAFVGSACVQIGLTMLNDTLDYVYGTDQSRSEEKNPFSGGSGVLADSLIKPQEMFMVIGALYLVALSVALYLTPRVGSGVMYFALLGFFLSVFYSLKPLRLAYHGLGELAMFIGYGPTITLGAYYVQTGKVTLPSAMAGVVPGLLMWAMIIVNEIPDYEEDFRAAKRNIVVRWGLDFGRKLYALSLLSLYIFITTGVLLGLFPSWTLLTFGSLYFAVRSIRHLNRYYNDRFKVARANLDMVKTYSSTMLLLTLGFLLDLKLS